MAMLTNGLENRNFADFGPIEKHGSMLTNGLENRNFADFGPIEKHCSMLTNRVLSIPPNYYFHFFFWPIR